jgi:hypothetical protein
VWEHERKLNRAAEHFEQLKAQVVGWEEGQGYTLRVEPDPKPPSYVVRVDVERPVEDEPFPLVLGDFLQNARASLDYIAGELGHIGAGGAMPESDALATMFPITHSPEQYAQVVERRLPTVTQPVRAAIEDLQPYKTGGDLWAIEPLWILNELSRLDRHRFLHIGYERIGMLALDPDASRNVCIKNIHIIEGSTSDAELEAWDEAQLMQAEGRRAVEDSAILATFYAVPIDPSQEMHMEWESAIQIGFDQDRLPATLPHLGGTFGDNIPWLCKEIIRDIREAFRSLAPFLPAEPPRR